MCVCGGEGREVCVGDVGVWWVLPDIPTYYTQVLFYKGKVIISPFPCFVLVKKLCS